MRHGAISAGDALPGTWLPKSVQVHGVFGLSHLFRPVISSNLRSLRIHHSLVTQIPTLAAPNLTALARIWLAETYLRESAELAFPQAFVPDMNPRIRSLTLTGLPRYSMGPLIRKILAFLDLVHKQEQDIARATGPSRRSPHVLSGLRHFRLDFDRDLYHELGLQTATSNIDVDARALMTPAADEFSFFSASWDSPGPGSSNDSTIVATSKPSSAADSNVTESGRLRHYPLAGSQGDSVKYHGQWNGDDPDGDPLEFDVRVWVGSGVLGPHVAVNAYMRNLANQTLRSAVCPASPGHVVAGVPPGSYIFSDAWDAIFACPPDVRKPTAAECRMHDVADEIRKYRARNRAAGRGNWSGKLELGL